MSSRPAASWPQRLFGDLISGLSLLTRVPMPDHSHSGAASAWCWPVVGLAIGACAALFAWLGLGLGLRPGPLAALILMVIALVTGALHEDGLADSADGLLGGRTPERRLEIMKDSRIGSYGGLALFLVGLMQWSALSDLLTQGTAIPALLVAAAVSRLPMVLIMAGMQPARRHGISASAGRPSGRVALAAFAISLAIAAGCLGWTGVFMLLTSLLPAALLAIAAQKLLHGQTGDILGASQQLGFAAALLLL